jgi:hypothetical protein
MVFCNISVQPENQITLAQQGAIPNLISLLGDSTPVVARHAVLALTNMCNNANNQVFVLRNGGIGPIVQLFNALDADCSRFAGLALSNISTHRLNRVPIVKLGGLKPFFAMALSTRIEVQRASALGLYNVSCSAENHLSMLQENIIGSLVILGGVNDLECKRYSVMALANLASNIDTRLAAAGNGGLQVAIALLKEEDVDCQRYACICLTNLSNIAGIQENIIVHGGLPSIVSLIQHGNIETVRQALLVLSNIASNKKNHHEVIHLSGAMAALHAVYVGEDEQCREYAAFVISNLCCSTEDLIFLCRNGAIPPLVMLCKSSVSSTRLVGISGLRLLSAESENWSRLIQGGVLGSFQNMFDASDDSTDIQKESACCLAELTLSAAHRVEIVFKCMNALCYMAGSTNYEVARLATGAIANLAEEPDTHEYIVSEDGNKRLAMLLKHDCLDVSREALRAVANMLSSFRHQQYFIDDAIRDIIILGYKGDVECDYHVALAMRKLSPNLKSHTTVIESGAFKCLFKLCGSQDLPTQYQAMMAIRDLSSNPAYKWKCVTDGALPVLAVAIHSLAPEYQVLGLSALRHLTSENMIKPLVLQEDILRNLLRCSSIYITDVQLQTASVIANLSEYLTNQMTLVNAGAIASLIPLSRCEEREIQIDAARALSNLASNDEAKLILYRQGALEAMVQLSLSADPIIQEYMALGMRFLASDADVRVNIVEDKKIAIFITLALSPLEEYQKTAASSFRFFSMKESSRRGMIEQGCLSTVMALCLVHNVETKRCALGAIANIASSLDLQQPLLDEGILNTLTITATHTDNFVQRETSRAFAALSCLAENVNDMMRHYTLPAVLSMARSLDLPCQRYATLTLCNMCATEYKVRIVDDGGIQPLIFTSKYPDERIQSLSALALAFLAIGVPHNKLAIVRDGALRPIVDMLRLPNIDVQLCSCMAVNAVTLGESLFTKSAVMTEHGLEALIMIMERSTFIELKKLAAFAIGSLSENDEVKARLVELGAAAALVDHISTGETTLRRSIGYFLASASQQIEYHESMDKVSSIEGLVTLLGSEDIECQEYAAFAVAHMSSNTSLQTKIVASGVVPFLLKLMNSSDIGGSEETHDYSTIALLKLSENIQNYEAITKLGGIQALVRLNRSRSADENIQFKAALTIGKLAASAVELLPSSGFEGSRISNGGIIGHGARLMGKIRPTRTQSAMTRPPISNRGTVETMKYLNDTDASKNVAPSIYNQRVEVKSNLVSQLIDEHGRATSVIRRVRPASSSVAELRSRNSL